MGNKKGCTFAPTNDASVAQLVEHLTLNQGVQGSTPCGSTRIKVNQLSFNWLAFFFVCFSPLIPHLFQNSIKIAPKNRGFAVLVALEIFPYGNTVQR